MRFIQRTLQPVICFAGSVFLLAACASVDKRSPSEANESLWNVEVVLSRALRVPVSVGYATLGDFEDVKQLDLFDVVIENPPEFETRRFLEVPRVVITIDKNAPERGPLVIRSLHLVDPELSYEWSAEGSNFDVLQYLLESYLKGGPRPNERTLEIQQLQIDSAQVNLADIWLDGELVSFTLQPLTLESLGVAESGLPPEQLMYSVFNSVQGRTNGSIAAFKAKLRAMREAVQSDLRRADWEFEQFFDR